MHSAQISFLPGGKEKDAFCSYLTTSARGVLAFPIILLANMHLDYCKRLLSQATIFHKIPGRRLVIMHDLLCPSRQIVAILTVNRPLSVHFLQPDQNKFCNSVPSLFLPGAHIMYVHPKHQMLIAHLYVRRRRDLIRD